MSSSRPGLHRSITDVQTISRSSSALFRHFHHGKRESSASIAFHDSVDQGYGSMGSQLSSTNKARFTGFYDDFTTVDWVRDFILESERRSMLSDTGGLRGKLKRLMDGGQGWILITIVAVVFACITYAIDMAEEFLMDSRKGYCKSFWIYGKSHCADEDWVAWDQPYNFTIYLVLSVLFAGIACILTLQTKTENPLVKRHVFDAEGEYDQDTDSESGEIPTVGNVKPHTVQSIYTAYGSGVPEVKTILSGFIIRRFLGLRTLIYKSVGLVFSISSGLCLGKEGPYVHLATCVGNIVCRVFPKFNRNDIKRRQVLSAAASAGVALAFGSPLGGVLFSLEEVSYYFLPHQLFRIFFCAMMSALCLKFLDPYGTGKIVLFELKYPQSAEGEGFAQMIHFVVIGIIGGIYGALFCKIAMFWGGVRSRKFSSPFTEVVIIAIITSILSFGNRYTSAGAADLLLHITSLCDESNKSDELCAVQDDSLPLSWNALPALSYALVVKTLLAVVTFGSKVPSGIYVPTMIVGALFGRIYGMVVAQVVNVAGIYAMAGAGAFMAGVTRMNVTLAVILFELTGSMNHVLPFSITILVANWVANAIEPYSLYELLIHKNNFPFLDNKTVSFADSATLSELVTYIDVKKAAISLDSDNENNLITAGQLRTIASQHMFDACVPVLKRGICIATLPVPELEYSLDQTPGPDYWCRVWAPAFSDGIEAVDLTVLADRSPLTLDIDSPLALVQMVFVKIGARQVCVSRNGKFVGILHRKKFIDFVTQKEK